MKINLILVRHGQSEGNVDESVYYTKPDHKIELTELGMNQALAAGSKLNTLYPNKDNNVLIHSPWTRAKNTAQLIGSVAPFRSVTEDPLIHEISIVNSFSCMDKKEDFESEEKSEFSHYWHKTGTSENYADVYQRARIFHQDLILNRYNLKEGDNVVVVSHGVFLLMLRGVIKNISVDNILDERWLKNCEMELIPTTILNLN